METELPGATRATAPRPGSRAASRKGRLSRAPRWQRWVAASAVVAVIASGVGWALASGSSAPASANTAAARSAVGRATTLVTQAGSAMSNGMAAIDTVPTVATVSAVVDPYLVSLQHYEAALAGATLASSAATWRNMVLTHVRDLIALLQSLPSTPSASLGNWINGFYLQTAELQTAIQGLVPALGSPSG